MIAAEVLFCAVGWQRTVEYGGKIMKMGASTLTVTMFGVFSGAVGWEHTAVHAGKMGASIMLSISEVLSDAVML